MAATRAIPSGWGGGIFDALASKYRPAKYEPFQMRSCIFRLSFNLCMRAFWGVGAMARSVSAGKLAQWRERPDIFVREVFGVEPDPWQDEALRTFPGVKRLAMKASKGPGKTATLAWIGWNFLLTRPQPKAAATSITSDNLADNLWTEMAKWRAKSPMLTQMFEWQKTRIFAKHHPETWFMTARGWSRSASPQQQADTLAGLHADYILFLLDETGSMPDAVMTAAEAALASGIEAHVVQAGNPNMLEGPLYRACHAERGLWHVVEITGDPEDPKRSTRVDVQWAKDQIARFGRDNPWVLVNVFGKFPPGSLNALIGIGEVEEAFARRHHASAIAHAPKVLGVDVARFGDDASVVFPRQGVIAFEPLLYRNLDSMTGAGMVARKMNEWEADGCFIDETGGFGAGWIDALRRLGKAPIGVHFSSQPANPRYYNKRAEMYFELVEWIRGGGQLPHCPEVSKALSQTTYTFKGDRLILEEKAQLKERLGFSPDHADALALTFAQPIERVPRSRLPSVRRGTREYDPFAEMWEPQGGERPRWMM